MFTSFCLEINSMIFRRLILSALLVGFLSGAVFSLLQIAFVNPIIFAAETFEVAEPGATDADTHQHQHDHSHTHNAEAWAPEDGSERTFYTFLSNVLAGIGFSALILSLMSQLQGQGITRISHVKGIIWGAAGFTAFFVAPGIGLPPEIPGIEAAAIESRQLWWVAAVACVGLGLLVAFFAPIKLKLIGVVLMVVPYIAPIPHHEGAAFSHPDPAAVEQLTALHQEFILTSGAANLVFWLVLGVISAWALNRLVFKGAIQRETNFA